MKQTRKKGITTAPRGLLLRLKNMPIPLVAFFLAILLSLFAAAWVRSTEESYVYDSIRFPQQQHRFFHPPSRDDLKNKQFKNEPTNADDDDGGNEYEDGASSVVKKAAAVSAMTSTVPLSTPGCLREDCVRHTASTIARAFPNRTDKSTWCLPALAGNKKNSSEDSNAGEDAVGPFRGILLTKVPKGASSTSAGVALRIAARHGCGAVEWQHRLAADFRQPPPSRSYAIDNSFLYTTVREPAARAVSTVFFHTVSRRNATATTAAATGKFILRQLKSAKHSHFGAISTGQGGFQLRYTALHNITEYSAWTPDAPESVLNPAAVVEHVKGVIDTYDYILVPERMDESLTAMALLLGIDVGDVLVTSSKVAGSRFHLLHPTKKTFHCVATQKSVVRPIVRNFLQSATWRAMNYGDYLLHEAAKQSLDLTIAAIGIDRFAAALDRFRNLKRLELERCAPSVKFPCSDAGEPQLQIARQNCYLYYYDFGCGYPCIDSMIADYDDNNNGTNATSATATVATTTTT